MPVAIAPMIWSAAITGGSQVAGAAIGAHGARKGAEAELAANREALQFQREQAQRQAGVDETNRHANYDQWAAGQHRLGMIGALLGQGEREIPGYVPAPPANYLAPPPPAPTPRGMFGKIFAAQQARRGSTGGFA